MEIQKMWFILTLCLTWSSLTSASIKEHDLVGNSLSRCASVLEKDRSAVAIAFLLFVGSSKLASLSDDKINEIYEFLKKSVFADPDFQTDPDGFLRDLQARRGRFERLIFPNDPAQEFLEFVAADGPGELVELAKVARGAGFASGLERGSDDSALWREQSLQDSIEEAALEAAQLSGTDPSLWAQSISTQLKATEGLDPAEVLSVSHLGVDEDGQHRLIVQVRGEDTEDVLILLEAPPVVSNGDIPPNV